MFGDPRQLLSRLATTDFEGHDEQSIREQWIYPLLMLLGYGDPQHLVDIPFKVDLAEPVRAIGHHRFEVDYRPTVFGRGMWIIEAKKPAEDLFSPQHLGQAWSYATHPEVDVPFIVMANGLRICVFDITKLRWDENPEVDIAQADLPTEFGRLDEVLGARKVADFVRRQQLRHLRTALTAQLDEDALDKTLRDVEEIVAEARPAVRRNRSDLFLEAFMEAMAERDRSAREIGVLGLALGCISPAVPIGADVETCAQMIREMDPGDRTAAFDDFAEAARIGDTVRMTFGLRVLRLAVALRLADDPACGERARQIADAAAHDAVTALADDPLGAAAHQFERVLPAFLARFVLADADDAIRVADQLRAHMDVEAWIRRDAGVGLGPGAMLDRQVEILFRMVWSNFTPWTTEVLHEVTDALRSLLPKLPIRKELRVGQVGNAFYETHLTYDPLAPGTKNVIRDVADPPSMSAGHEADIAVRTAFASELLDRYFDGDDPSPDEGPAS